MNSIGLPDVTALLAVPLTILHVDIKPPPLSAEWAISNRLITPLRQIHPVPAKEPDPLWFIIHDRHHFSWLQVFKLTGFIVAKRVRLISLRSI
jgi:hypothetical protein